MLSAYSPASSLAAGKLNWPLSSLTTLTVTMPFLALTTTPSMAPSSAEETLPTTAGGDLGSADAAAATPARTKVAAMNTESRERMFSLQAGLQLVGRVRRVFFVP